MTKLIATSRPYVSRLLSSNYYKMAKEQGIEHECPVCLESCMHCEGCFMLLSCGHVLHSQCFHLQEKLICPVCRNGEFGIEARERVVHEDEEEED